LPPLLQLIAPTILPRPVANGGASSGAGKASGGGKRGGAGSGGGTKRSGGPGGGGARKSGGSSGGGRGRLVGAAAASRQEALSRAAVERAAAVDSGEAALPEASELGLSDPGEWAAMWSVSLPVTPAQLSCSPADGCPVPPLTCGLPPLGTATLSFPACRKGDTASLLLPHLSTPTASLGPSRLGAASASGLDASSGPGASSTLLAAAGSDDVQVGWWGCSCC
jgi:hypothetical protein